jgi:hypothetical protein
LRPRLLALTLLRLTFAAVLFLLKLLARICNHFANNRVNFYDGQIRIVTPEGKEFLKFLPRETSGG